ncbi:hypothetical protein Aple_068890 [Acrocarpospora pleiomorpha]|uniref:Uncharacterized protein n=1 Tax=Acrocarpospora pleiomorpha TaxID=90975 RepID=A0A5M3XT29_9ACTN|nr:hypothetical protein Aple_068890 [Acrocarpospora pleiomorpha]
MPEVGIGSGKRFVRAAAAHCPATSSARSSTQFSLVLRIATEVVIPSKVKTSRLSMDAAKVVRVRIDCRLGIAFVFPGGCLRSISST